MYRYLPTPNHSLIITLLLMIVIGNTNDLFSQTNHSDLWKKIEQVNPKNDTTQATCLDPSLFHHKRGSLRNSQITFERTKKGRVAFLGGSITYSGGWRDSVSNYLIDRFPNTEFEFIEAGISSMGTTPAAFRLNRDVLAYGKVDLLFEEAAVNDETNERTTKEQIRGMEGIVRHLRTHNPQMDLVIMHFVDPDKIKSYNNGTEPVVITNHETVAKHYQISTLNLAKEVTERIDHKEFTWENDFKNLHPSPFGQGIYARSMIQFLDHSYTSLLHTDDKISVHPMPQPLDQNNYSNGKLIDISSAKRYKGWSINPNWIPTDGSRVRANYHQVPMLISEDPESKLKFNFQGNTVGIAIAAGFDAGIIEYRIDKGEWQEQDLFTKWSMNVHLPWYYTLAAGLKDKKHTLEIRIKEEKNSLSKGNACRIRYFYVN